MTATPDGVWALVIFLGVAVVLIAGAGWGSWRDELEQMAKAEKPIAATYVPPRDYAAEFYAGLPQRVDEWYAPLSPAEIGEQQ